MNDRFKSLTMDLEQALSNRAILFIKTRFQQEEDANDVLNLVLSAYLSSLANMLYIVAGTEKQLKEGVETILKNILASLDETHKCEGNT